MAAGLGTRMRSVLPKHFHPLLGRRLVDWVLEAARPLGPEPLVVVASPEGAERFEGIPVAVQAEPRGTGDAIAAARELLEGKARSVLVLSGDTPLLTTELLADLVATHRREDAAATVLSFSPPDVREYGRIVRDERGTLRAIVEAADATADELAIREVNSSIYVFESEALWPALERLEPANAQGELYLTDAVRLLVEAGRKVAVHAASDPAEAEGVNTRAELADAAQTLRARLNEAHMLAGVTIVDPQTTWIEPDVELEPDATVHPFTLLRGRTRVAAGAEVGPHAVVLDAVVGPDVLVGPFCYVRPGTVLEAGAKAGTFVEIKNSHVGEGAKVPHLSYIGDADIGAASNIGAGNITANFPHAPGEPKGRTTIGRNVRTGVNNSFRAPVTIGDDAWIALGTVITEDVPPGSLAGFPPRQVTKDSYVYEKHGNRDE
ncbi:MAG: bifunctional UDP-N-acetylglucosamine pyrophosphorylase / glucosamine-phosphate N-acetyltransferase [Gaiellaceae bacterium]|jgi:bifunctional UDP-N-acetylglucosamine pyrophosphorylase/glucosamine-1-phosphate N-acetyltransferase|nr:bifunctional UDP-N-acetylglucosamine pyrophosphorylase / glucosamine-phosphate N-acetyltransferase [Gaiellaceae bacterium]